LVYMYPMPVYHPNPLEIASKQGTGHGESSKSSVECGT
jgi:hypothetical protein